ncbi:uncharacterized protein LOC114262720 [Camellia sinensis]|uniref:uncharacterized protein LOC114262720 n=1 Tax=Camellia sinensis TaxID=4442 RepID=UPI001035AC1B|nr:uncharacterized protein LOC114262720 [Camellia sinensis]
MYWNLKGDRNTRFFHVMASSRQTKNTINSIIVGGVNLEDPYSVKNEVWLHFSNLFKDDWKIRPTLKGEFKSIRLSTDFHVLEADFSEEEIWAVVNDCNRNKAPGPNDFNLMFFQKFWKVLKGEVLKFMQEFHASGSLILGLNSSFITLVPKKEKALSLNEFRSISLIGFAYKILSKVLTNRLKLVMPSIIGDSESAFLEGRNMLDGVLIANEVVDSWVKSKKAGLIFKIDFEKAFDFINWNFLFSMLANFGFGEKWISWIQKCVSTARISIFVNGSPTKEFNPQKGLRQGDPLSPFLFNLDVEALNILLQKAMDLRLLKGVSVGVNDEVQLIVISGSVLAEFACLLNRKSQNLPIKYLGLPLGANPKRKKTWKPVVDKLPEGIAKELDKIQASFLWGGPDLKRKIHLVKWSEGVGKWIPNPSLNTSSSYIWNRIVAVGDQNQSFSLYYASNLQLKVGNGCRIRFWSDSWCGNVCLKEEFPRLFSLSSQKEGLLKDFVEVSGTTKNWLFTFRRSLFVWEKNELLRLYGLVGLAPSIQLESQDSAIWRTAKPGQSFVSNLYNQTSRDSGGTESFSHLAKQVFYLNDTKWGQPWQVVQRVQHRGVFDVLEVGDGESLDEPEENNVFQQENITDIVPIDIGPNVQCYRDGVEAEVVTRVRSSDETMMENRADKQNEECDEPDVDYDMDLDVD